VIIWHSYEQKVDCVVHFLRLLAAWWPGTQSAHNNHFFVCKFLPNIHRLKKISTVILGYKPFLILLLTIPPNLKYMATVPCNLLLIICFPTFKFHKAVWQRIQGVVGFLITVLLQSADLLQNEPVKEF